MQKDEFIQALNHENGNVNPHPWHIIKPKQSINSKSNQDKRKPELQTQKPNPIYKSEINMKAFKSIKLKGM